MQRTWKIGLALVLMLLTAIPTSWFLVYVYASGGLFIILFGLCTIVFISSLYVLIRTIASKKE